VAHGLLPFVWFMNQSSRRRVSLDHNCREGFFAMASKLMIVCLSALFGVATANLAGCANFENSFGELGWSDDQPAELDTTGQKRSNDFSETEPNLEKTPYNERKYSLEGLQVELSPGAVTQ
jgi:hypothetical protein